MHRWSLWMPSYMLKLNPRKTTFIWAVSSGRQHHLDRLPINVFGNDIILSMCISVLVCYSENNLQMMSYVNRMVSTCFFQLHRIRQIRRNLTVDAVKSLINEFEISRLDHCNSLLAGLSSVQSEKLQSVLNVADRVIFGRCKCMHINHCYETIYSGWNNHFDWTSSYALWCIKPYMEPHHFIYMSCAILTIDVDDVLHCDQLLMINYWCSDTSCTVGMWSMLFASLVMQLGTIYQVISETNSHLKVSSVHWKLIISPCHFHLDSTDLLSLLQTLLSCLLD